MYWVEIWATLSLYVNDTIHASIRYKYVNSFERGNNESLTKMTMFILIIFVLYTKAIVQSTYNKTGTCKVFNKLSHNDMNIQAYIEVNIFSTYNINIKRKL